MIDLKVKCFLPSPLDSIRDAVLTVSPNKQYRGILSPTTPATQGPGQNVRQMQECNILILVLSSLSIDYVFDIEMNFKLNLIQFNITETTIIFFHHNMEHFMKEKKGGKEKRKEKHFKKGLYCSAMTQMDIIVLSLFYRFIWTLTLIHRQSVIHDTGLNKHLLH